MGLALLTNTFDVPKDFEGVLPCVANASKFQDRALDMDPYDEDFQALTRDEQQEALAAKQIAERVAVAECNGCPLLTECRTWAVSVSVHGVAGGTTQAERRATQGWTGPELVPGEPSPSEARQETSVARGAIRLDRVSEETLAMMKFLADGDSVIRPREDVLAAGAPYVDDATADHWGRHSGGDAAAKRIAGRRKFLLNRLDITIRRGRINATKTDSGVMLALAPDVASALLTAA